MPDPSQDLRNKVLGRKAEKLTRHYLRRRGYKIVAKNYMTPFGEADIVARAPDGTYCFVEVKARTSGQLSSPLEAITPEKRERYRMIAKCFCAQRRREEPVRFDVAAVLDGKLEYLEDAFM